MAYIQDVQESVPALPEAGNLTSFVVLSQNENGRKLLFKIVGVDIPSGSTATFSGTKPDGVVYSTTGEISGNVVTVNEDIQMTAVAGSWDAKIRVLNGGNVIASAKVRMTIDADPVAPDSIPSDSQLDGIVAECQAYAESARSDAYGSPLTASTAAGMIDKTRVYVYTGSETGYTNGHWYYWDGTAWADGGTYNSSGIQTDTTLSVPGMAADAKAAGDEITDLKEETNENENDFNTVVNLSRQYLKGAKVGKLYDISSGKPKEWDNANCTTYEPIEGKAGKTYYFINLYAYFCLFDDGNTVSRLSNSTATTVNGSFTCESDGVFYITIDHRVSVRRYFTDTKASGESVNTSTNIINASLAVDGYVHIKIDANGENYDYRNPIFAVRYIDDASESKQYMLDIYPGTYNLQDAIGAQEQTGSIWGLTLPNYVHMRGIGNHDDIIINCALPNSSSASAVEYTSVLNLKQNNTLENLTFTGTNVRYVVHDESSNTYKDWKRIVKNCRFVHNGNASGFWAYTNAWGEGCSSGSYSYFEDCVFENNSYVAPYGFHTNTAFESACTHIFKNCQFIQHYIGNDSTGAFMIDDIQCGQPINVEFVGCSFSRFIFVQNHNSTTDIEELNITGHANSPVLLQAYRPNVVSPKRLFTKFSDEVAMVYNPYDAITAGRPLRYTSYKDNNVGIEQSNGLQCAGIALDTIPAQGIGYMKYAGIIDLSTVGVSGVNIGDKVGVSSWSVAKVTDGTEFARAIQNSVIKFL